MHAYRQGGEGVACLHAYRRRQVSRGRVTLAALHVHHGTQTRGAEHGGGGGGREGGGDRGAQRATGCACHAEDSSLRPKQALGTYALCAMAVAVHTHLWRSGQAHAPAVRGPPESIGSTVQGRDLTLDPCKALEGTWAAASAVRL
eukprot:267719-Chlamydomonas_euryale.AAC.1